MKCAVAIMRTSSVRSVRLSIAIVNHAGVPGPKNDASHAGRACTVVDPSTGASVTLTQPGTGWVTGVWADSVQVLPPGGRSQRCAPTMIPAQPRRTWYATRFGAETRHVLMSGGRGSD